MLPVLHLIDEYFVNEMQNNVQKIALYIRYTLRDLDLYIMTWSKLCLNGIFLISYLCGIWLISGQKMLKQDVTIIRVIIKSPKRKHGTQ